MISVSETTVREIDTRLRRLYGLERLGNKEDPLDELIFIILSAKTREEVYFSTFERLRRRFASWEDAARAEPEEIEALISPGGLARKKSRSISLLLRTLVAEAGHADLSLLRDMDDDSAEAFLRRLPGVGPKTARCVLAYSLGRAVFAVDTNIGRIMRRLGLSEYDRVDRRVQDWLQERIPPDLRYSLHVNLVVHGRRICTPSHPRCKDCILASLCPSRECQ